MLIGTSRTGVGTPTTRPCSRLYGGFGGLGPPVLSFAKTALDKVLKSWRRTLWIFFFQLAAQVVKSPLTLASHEPQPTPKLPSSTSMASSPPQQQKTAATATTFFFELTLAFWCNFTSDPVSETQAISTRSPAMNVVGPRRIVAAVWDS